jgi:hypothetical protein
MHQAAQILHEVQSRGSLTVPLGVNEEIDAYLESMLVLQHAQRLEMERMVRLVDDYCVMYSNRVRSLQVITPSPSASHPDVVSSGKKGTSISSPNATSQTSHAPPVVPAAAGFAVASSASDQQSPATPHGQAQSNEVERFISRVAEENRLKRRRSNLPRTTTQLLRRWIFDYKDHPYPTDVQKKVLCEQTGLTLTQLNNWFINNRRRLLNSGRRGDTDEEPTPPASPAQKRLTSTKNDTKELRDL